MVFVWLTAFFLIVALIVLVIFQVTPRRPLVPARDWSDSDHLWLSMRSRAGSIYPLRNSNGFSEGESADFHVVRGSRFLQLVPGFRTALSSDL